MNFNKLNGYMFEDLIASLFKKMGFTVEQTSLSGDGGIDIIAYNKQPVFSGKYLIQCKNWNNIVGQPEVRDLYGVVMSEQANKGILITTSHFTEQAIQFADNKNIELIDYDILIKLLKNYNLLEKTKESKNTIINFTDYDEFDKQKHLYLKSKIENNRTEKLYYDNLKNFYHQYIISNNYKINKSGLINEYINLNNEIIKRFCKKSKEKIAEGNCLKYINGYLYILKGDLFTAIEIYKDLDLLSVRPNVDFSSKTFKFYLFSFYNFNKPKESDIVWKDNNDWIYKTDSDSPLVILQNLYLLFSKLNYERGLNYLDTLISMNYECIKKLPYSQQGVIAYNFKFNNGK